MANNIDVEVKKFGAETGKILNLMIHSLYTNKDIFLRELISNSSDACDKLRYLSIENPNLISEDPHFKINISYDKDKRILVIQDNGIGMNKEDLINNIGTIASSGTEKFISQMTGNKAKDVQLIGQFGVGFYACFMVADKVEVISKKAGEDKCFKWISDGKSEYEISEADSETIIRGTKISMHLKEDMDEYLDSFKIKHIVKTYSDHISVPVELANENGEAEVINSAAALWKRSKNEISEEEYKSFYKAVSHQPDDPWLTLHNKNEGVLEYTNLLFIPSIKPFDLFHPDRKTRVKLYVKRVYIADEGVDIVPSNLRFLRGIVDSEDLPLNISRESLQYSSVITKIKKSVAKKVYTELKKKLNDDREGYEKFWQNFGACIKEGLCEHIEDKDQILDICLFKSALKGKYLTLNEYISAMPEKQKMIYFLRGEENEKLTQSAQIEGFIKNNIDVLLFTDAVDDFWVNVCSSYKEHEIKSVTRSSSELDDILGKKEENTDSAIDDNKHNQALVDFFKETLASNVSDVKISKKLVDSPVCLGVAEHAMDIRMERYLKEQKQIMHGSAKILEINAKHPIIGKITDYLNADDKESAANLAHILFDEACIMEGENVVDLASFAKRLNSLITKAIN
jgi:molecular chaperone HtpG